IALVVATAMASGADAQHRRGGGGGGGGGGGAHAPAMRSAPAFRSAPVVRSAPSFRSMPSARGPAMRSMPSVRHTAPSSHRIVTPRSLQRGPAQFTRRGRDGGHAIVRRGETGSGTLQGRRGDRSLRNVVRGSDNPSIARRKPGDQTIANRS